MIALASDESPVTMVPHQDAVAHAVGLTPRELDVLRLLVDARSDKRIGESLRISHRTVMTHVSNMLGKLGVSTRAQVAPEAISRGLI